MSELRALLADTTERVLGSNPDWAAIEDAVRAPVIEPCQAAVALALGMVLARAR